MFDLVSTVQEMVKEAEERKKKRHLFRQSRRLMIGGKPVSREEAANIRSILAERQPETKIEEQVQQITGKPPTTGQLVRGGTVGALGGIGVHGLGQAIEGGKPWIPRTKAEWLAGGGKHVLAPRSLARAAGTGVAFATAIPVARHLWDIHTARKRPEAF